MYITEFRFYIDEKAHLSTSQTGEPKRLYVRLEVESEQALDKRTYELKHEELGQLIATQYHIPNEWVVLLAPEFISNPLIKNEMGYIQ